MTERPSYGRMSIDDVPPSEEMAASRMALHAMLGGGRPMPGYGSFPRSATMRAILNPRYRVFVLAGAGALALIAARRLPAGRIAALVSAYRGARDVLRAVRH